MDDGKFHRKRHSCVTMNYLGPYPLPYSSLIQSAYLPLYIYIPHVQGYERYIIEKTIVKLCSIKVYSHQRETGHKGPSAAEREVLLNWMSFLGQVVAAVTETYKSLASKLLLQLRDS